MRIKLAAVVFVYLLATLVGKAADDQKEPVYEGKTLSEWIKALDDPDLELQKKAAEAIGKLGPKAGPAVPVLIQRAARVGDVEASSQAWAALDQIGKAAVPGLVVALKDRSAFVRATAARILSGLDVDAEEALPALAEAMKDQEANVRGSAALAYYRQGGPTDDRSKSLCWWTLRRTAGWSRVLRAAYPPGVGLPPQYELGRCQRWVATGQQLTWCFPVRRFARGCGSFYIGLRFGRPSRSGLADSASRQPSG